MDTTENKFKITFVPIRYFLKIYKTLLIKSRSRLDQFIDSYKYSISMSMSISRIL